MENCKFCGRPPKIDEHKKGEIHIRCEEHWSNSVGYHSDLTEAISRWNSRQQG